MAVIFRAVALAGALAGSTILAVPASASASAAVPLAGGAGLGASSAIFDISRPAAADATAAWGCRWGCGWGGWGGGWGRHRGWGGGWRRNRIDGGDVLIGAAIIGGAIAIANSNNRRRRDRDVVIVERDERDWDRDRDVRYRDDRRAAPRGTGSSGLDSAVSMCLDRIERDVRVDSVDDARRTASGWQVSGVLFNGAPFACRIGNNGQIDGIDYGQGFGRVGFSGDTPPADGQWSDDRYIAARTALGGAIRPDVAAGEITFVPGTGAEPPVRTAAAPPLPSATAAMPAYPGGPVPGEVIPETLEEATGG